jgi:nucleoside-diphosphate-sugar epimerase
LAAVRVAVVGATGNVGTSVLHSLASDPAVTSIVGIARRRPGQGASSDTDRDAASDTSTGARGVAAGKVTWVAADIARDPLDDHLRGADVVVQLAWLIQPSHQRAELWRTNVVGTGRVLDTIARLKVPALVYSSSVGAYSRGPKDRAVDESWPTDGIPELDYSWQKAYVERMLDRFERDEPGCRVVRLRPGLVFKAAAAPEIHRLFVGAAVPRRALGPWLAPLVARAPCASSASTRSTSVERSTSRRRATPGAHSTWPPNR